MNGYSLGIKDLEFKTSMQGIDVQHILNPYKNNILVWGANYTSDIIEASTINGHHSHNQFGIFLDNTYNRCKNIIFNLGIRIDHHPNTNNTLSNRFSVQYLKNEDNKYRFTFGTSFRNPDFIEFYYDRYSFYSNHPSGAQIYMRVFGRDNIKAEKASSFEAASNHKLTDKCSINISLFYSMIKNFVYFTADQTGQYIDGAGRIIIPVSFKNIGDAKQNGSEFEINYQFNNNYKCTLNYTYLNQKTDIADVKQLLLMTPKNTAYARLDGNFDNGIFGCFEIYYKSSTEWRKYSWVDPVNGSTTAGGIAEAYMFCNFNIGYKFNIGNNNSEFVISAFNIFDDEFDDYPMDTSDISRRITGRLSLKF